MAQARKYSEQEVPPLSPPPRVKSGGSDYALVDSVGDLTRKSSRMEIAKEDTLRSASAALDVRKLLDLESEAYRNDDFVNMASIFVIKKVHSKMASIKRSRSVLMLLSSQGMPSTILVADPKIFSSWDCIRGKTAGEIAALSADFSRYGKDTPGWRFPFSPREAKAKLLEDARLFELIYCDACEQDKSNPGIMRLYFAPESDGTERKDKAFEFRPEPYSKEAAAQRCQEMVAAVRAGIIHAYLQRPALMDRSIRASAIREWLARIKQYASERTVHGKSNLHHQVQLESDEQIQKIRDLLEWGADPNCTYGPTQMTPLHMAVAWRLPEVVDALLKAGADPSSADINGMTPLHLACVYGCATSVELLHATGQVDINAEAMTPLGSLRPIDCALECEDRNALPIWHSLQAKGVDMTYTRIVQSHPLPYPTQKVGPFLATIISMHRLRETETELDLAKIELLLQDGADPNERDAFGRTALCYSSSPAMTELLLSSGADPTIGVGPEDLQKYAIGCGGRAYLEQLLSKIDALKEEAYPPSGRVSAEASTNMAHTILSFKNSISASIQRAQLSGYPIGEALASGKTAKVKCLIDAGVKPLVNYEQLPSIQLDLSWFCADGSEEQEHFAQLAGKAVWEGLALRLLWFTRFFATGKPVRGSQLFGSIYATERGEAVVEHLHKIHGNTVKKFIEAAESNLSPAAGACRGPIDTYEPTTQELMECQELTSHALSTLPVPDQQTYVKLTEDEAINQVTSAEARARTRSNAGAKLKETDSWTAYRARAMSFKRKNNGGK